MNWKVRIKNPYFWIGLIGLFLSTVGIEASALTSWDTMLDMLREFTSNPFQIGTFAVALIGIFVDPTTSGLTDSAQALTYTSPKKDEE
jgi:phi LC3 family holin